MSHRRATALRRERGMTIVELMISLVVSMLIIQGALMIIIASAKNSRLSLDRTTSQRGARAGIGILVSEIEGTGLNLPAHLAIRRFLKAAPGSPVDPDAEAKACAGTPELELASLDMLREWSVSSTAGDQSDGTITLDAAGKPTGGSDTQLLEGEWVFFFQSPRYDRSANAINHGHGMLRVAATRPAGGVTIATNNSSFGQQFGLNLGQAWPGSGHPKSLMRARVSKFGLACPDATKPFANYLYWQLSTKGSEKVPVAQYIKSLTFRFQLDTDGDGKPDGALVDELTVDKFNQVLAIEVAMTVYARQPDAVTGKCWDTADGQCTTQDFAQVVYTHNINTRSTQYIFVDNTGLKPTP
jgi:hypothetical protein